MKYTEKQVAELEGRKTEVVRGLQVLRVRLTQLAEAEVDGAKEYLSHGAARRASVMEHSIDRIFDLLPVDAETPVSSSNLRDVHAHLHAFLINLYGFFDNLAWAFVHKHGLLGQIRNKFHIGLFHATTQGFLPFELREYFQEARTVAWRNKYLVGYRDALAHRISPYIPPAELSQEDARRYNELSNERMQSIVRMDASRADAISDELDTIGEPSFQFLHSFSEVDAIPVVLHPQIISDGMTVLEAGHRFLDHWQNRA